MLLTTLVVWAAVAAPASPQNLDHLQLGQLKAGQQIEITTTLRQYRATIVDPLSGEALVTVSNDGTRFSPPAKVFLIGATAGRYPEMMVKMGQLQVGLRIELGLGSMAEADRALSDPVKSLRIVHQ